MKQLASDSFVCLWGGGTSGSNIIVPEAYWYGMIGGYKVSTLSSYWNYDNFTDIKTVISKNITATGVKLAKYGSSTHDSAEFYVNKLPYLTFSTAGIYYMNVEFVNGFRRYTMNDSDFTTSTGLTIRDVGLWYNLSSWGSTEGKPVGPYTIPMTSDNEVVLNNCGVLLGEISEGETLTLWKYAPINTKGKQWSNSSSYSYSASSWATYGVGAFGTNHGSSSNQVYTYSDIVNISIEKIK